MQLRSAIEAFYRVESRRFGLWVPVLLGVGIWVYFALPVEPTPGWACLAAGPGVLIVSGLARRGGWGALALSWAILAVTAGFGLAILSARMADAPQIRWPLGETVEGRVIGVSRSASGRPRLLLDRLTVYGVEPGETPARVRLTVMDGGLGPAGAIPTPGQHIRVYASLIPTGERVEPGAFNFRRRAFFHGIGGIGLSRGRVLIVPPQGEPGPLARTVIRVAEIRDTLSRYLRTVLPGRQGAVAAALIVGDRADISDADNEALRISGLAHLLSISGLHMVILTGLIFGMVRLVLAAIPWAVYHLPAKKIAAATALLAGGVYLLLSGMTVPPQRAYVMVAVALGAVLLDRPAISLRALALAATLILITSPESLLDAGFQMSFAATLALVSGYEALRRWRATHRPDKRPAQGSPMGRWMRIGALYVAGLAFTSLLAGSATAPFAAYHFNRAAAYGLLANLLAVPLSGIWIAPAAVGAAVLAPFGLAEPALHLMGGGIEAIMRIAHMIAALPGASQAVRAAPPLVLGLIALGGLWLTLWRGRIRLAGVAVIAAGLIFWSHAPPRPDLLISPGGGLIGLMGPEGRALDDARYHGYAAETWLRRDGDMALQADAAARPGLVRDGRRLSGTFVNGWRLEFVGGRPDAAELARLCRPRTLLIARNGGALDGPCRYLGEAALAESGALAVRARGGGLIIHRASDDGRGRLWSAY